MSYLNGRVNIKTPNTSNLFAMYDKIPANQCTTYRNPTEGLWDNTDLSNAFFLKKISKLFKMEFVLVFIINQKDNILLDHKIVIH